MYIPTYPNSIPYLEIFWWSLIPHWFQSICTCMYPNSIPHLEILRCVLILPWFPLLRIENSTSIPTTLYEFPNGYNINLTIEKYKLCEGLFDSSNLKGVSGGNLLSIPSVTINSAAMCEVDIRPVCEKKLIPWLGGEQLLF